MRRVAFQAVLVSVLAIVGAWVAVQLQYAWQPSDAGSTGHATAVRFVGLALAGLVFAAAGHRRLVVVPAVLTYAVPAVLGHRLDLSGDTGETTYLHMVIECVLVASPGLVLAWLRRRQRAGPAPSPVALVVGGAFVSVVLGSHVLSMRPYTDVAETWVGQAALVALLAAYVGSHLRWSWTIVVVPILLWHEPLVDLLYLTTVPAGAPLGDYYDLAARAALAGLAVPAIDAIRRFSAPQCLTGVRRWLRPLLAAP